MNDADAVMDYEQLIKDLRWDGEHITKLGSLFFKVKQGENMLAAADAIESLLTYKKAIDNILKIGGLWVVDRSSDRPFLRYVDVDPFPKGARKYRLLHYNGQKLSYSNYAYVHSMDRDELARFLGETAAKWCDFEDKTEEEAKNFREWLDEEAADA